MSDLVRMVARAILPCDKAPGWGGCKGVCEPCDEQSRAAIAAVAEWLDKNYRLDRDGSVHRALTMHHTKKPKAAT